MKRGKLRQMQDRTEWHKSEKGCWSISLGRRGCRVRITQREPGGEFFRVAWLPGQGKVQTSLKTASRPEAKKRAEAFLRALAKEEWLGHTPLTLENLWNRYQKEAPQYQSNSEKTRHSKRKYAERLLLGFGRKKLAVDLTLDDVERYKEMRRTGRGWPDGGMTQAVKASAVQRDLQLLQTMINWARTVRNPDRSWLLQDNPLRGLKLPREENPSRPVSNYDRYMATRKAMQTLAAQAPQKRGRKKWIRLELALFLAEATGRRIGSIRGLCWKDIDFTTPSIWWNPAFDKRGRETTIPIPAEMAETLKQFRAKLEAFDGGWLFPVAKGDGPWDDDLFSQGLRNAERVAKLPKLRGSLWHALRRKWAIEHKDEPLSDVMAVGGWKDPKTLLACYQLADDATMLRVMSVPKKLAAAKSGT